MPKGEKDHFFKDSVIIIIIIIIIQDLYSAMKSEDTEALKDTDCQLIKVVKRLSVNR